MEGTGGTSPLSTKGEASIGFAEARVSAVFFRLFSLLFWEFFRLNVDDSGRLIGLEDRVDGSASVEERVVSREYTPECCVFVESS